MSDDVQTVVILGASSKKDRYSYRAFERLRQSGHVAIPVHPTLEEIDGVPVTPTLDQVDRTVDTLTVYVNPTVSADMSNEIVAMKPGRVIFNPGTESPELTEVLDANGIRHQEACTLVLLDTGQF